MEREKTRDFRIVKGERQWKMEGIFAEVKENHGLDRARYRGRAKMQIQAYMIAVVQNLKHMTTLAPVIEVAMAQEVPAFRAVSLLPDFISNLFENFIFAMSQIEIGGFSTRPSEN